MKYMLLAQEAPEDFALRDNKEKCDSYIGAWFAFGDAMRKSGVHVASEALEAPSSATTVWVRDGKRSVKDGPYPDAKEQLGGFCIIDAESLDDAVSWAKKCPASKNGVVDIRAVPFLEQGHE